jgi:hypothetical protein
MAIVEISGNTGQGCLGSGRSLTPPGGIFHLPSGVQEIPTRMKTNRGSPSPFNGNSVRPNHLFFVLLATLSVFACSPSAPGEPENDAISRELFITAYVELRVAAQQAPDQELTLRTRDRVLARVEVSENELLEFVEVHGRDVQFMRRLWEEVDSVLQYRRQPSERPDLGDHPDPGD